MEAATLDLNGVPCPVNWAQAKSHLEMMRPGQLLRILVDDPRAERDIPPAAEAEGWAVVEIAKNGPQLTILIER